MPVAQGAGVRGDAGRGDGRRTWDRGRVDLTTLVVAVKGWQAHATLDGERGRVLQLAGRPLSVAEVSGQLMLPLDAAKALVEDLLAAGALRTTAPVDEGNTPSRGLMLAVLEGLRRL